MNKKILHSCTSILVGKNATADGSVIIGRNEDFKPSWPKHFVVHPSADIDNNKYISNATGVTISLPSHRFKYTATPEWTDKDGVMEEDGINEKGVAMSATESAYSNSEVLGYDPYDEHGILEESMITIVLPYVDSARNGVKRLGNLIEQYGAGESDGVLFADNNEAWYMEIGSGHCWVAKKIPDNEYAVVANRLSIPEIDFEDDENYMFSKNLINFTVKHHLWNKNEKFVWNKIFGTSNYMDQEYNTARVWSGQRILTPSVKQSPDDLNLPFSRKPDKLLFINDISSVLRDHFDHTIYDTTNKDINNHKYRPISLPMTQESHILQMRPNMPSNIGDIHWLAMGVSVESIYVPFYSGISDTPADYKVGTENYSEGSAYWLYKHMSVLLDAHYNKFINNLVNIQKELYSKFLGIIDKTDKLALSAENLDEQTKILNNASFEMANISRQEIKKFISYLITNETNLSPLSFKTDKNL